MASAPALSPASNEDILFAEGEYQARPLVLTPDQMAVIWDRMSQFPILFASEKETDFSTFRDILEDDNSIVVAFHTEETGKAPVGLGMIYGIVPGVEAKIQLSFFDATLKGRESLVRSFVTWIFDTLLVRRCSAHIRADARSMRAFLERCGFYFEGVLKNWIKKENRYYDMYLYGITELECDEHWKEGRSWAKPRVRLLEAYETR